MQLIDIVCDLEYAARLKALGLNNICPNGKPPMLFGYYRAFKGNDILNPTDDFAVNKAPDLISPTPYDHFIPAYTVAELGEMLPTHIELTRVEFYSNDYDYICNAKGAKFFADPKEANARAKLLIWLIENGHVNVEDLNK